MPAPPGVLTPSSAAKRTVKLQVSETLHGTERMVLSGEPSPLAGVGMADADQHSMRQRMRWSMRHRMIWSRGLFVAAGLVSFLGFLLVAAGTASEISILGANSWFGSATLSSLIPWGIVFIGLGVMLGFFGAAVKGPSVEWKDISPDSKEWTTAELVGLIIVGLLVAIGLVVVIWLL